VRTDGTTAASVHRPALVIRLEVEAAPALIVDCQVDGEERRLRDWITASPRLCALVADALELAEMAEGLR
jgi:hypothetical protein